MGTELTKSVKHTGNIPRKDADMSSLGQSVVAAWKANAQIGLIWTDVNKHGANVNTFGTTLSERESTGGGRKELTGKLAALNVQIDEGAASIKGYLVYKYEKAHAPDYYPQFGIEKVGSKYIIPGDQQKRRDALGLTLAAISAHGFDNEKYGKVFWQTTLDNYTALLAAASAIDGTVSQKVGTKNDLRKTIVKTHNALINVIKGNYPDTWKNVIREWGFQKEKY